MTGLDTALPIAIRRLQASLSLAFMQSFFYGRVDFAWQGATRGGEELNKEQYHLQLLSRLAPTEDILRRRTRVELQRPVTELLSVIIIITRVAYARLSTPGSPLRS
jgi:hypothetical protein